MFCIKCGAKAIEDSEFCNKCGAKLITDESASNVNPKLDELSQVQVNETKQDAIELVEPVKSTIETSPQEIVQPVISNEDTGDNEIIVETLRSFNNYKLSREMNNNEACEIIKTGVNCPKVKNVFLNPKKGFVIVKGKFYNYILNVVNGNVRVGMGFSLLFAIILGLLIAPLAYIAANIGWNMMDGYGFDEVYIIPLIAIGLALAIYLTIVALLGSSESKVVLPHIFGLLESKPIAFPPSKKIKPLLIIIPSVILVVLASMLILWSSGILDDLFTSDNDSYDDYVDADSRISLNQSYKNDEEGFSFNYPSAWEEMNTDDLDIQNCVTVLGSSFAGANITITKVFDDGNLFYLTKSDFQELSWMFYEFNIIELININIDNVPARKLVYSCDDGKRLRIDTLYFYVRGEYLYTVNCSSLQDDFNTNEPIFDAMMNTYTITRSTTNQAPPDNNANTSSTVPEDEAYKYLERWLIERGIFNDVWIDNIWEEELNGEEYYCYYLLNYAGDLGQSGTFARIYINKNTCQAYVYDKNSQYLLPLDDWFNNNYGDIGTGTEKLYPGEVLYNGIPVNWFFDYTIEEIIDAWGEPLDGYGNYGDIEFWQNIITGKIISVHGKPSAFDINGVSLDKNREGLIALLGNPVYEGTDFDWGIEKEVFYMGYELSDYEISFVMPSSDDKPSSINIRRPE